MVRMRGRTRSVTTVPTRATTIPATSPLVRALAVRGGQHGDDEREATAEDEGTTRSPAAHPELLGSAYGLPGGVGGTSSSFMMHNTTTSRRPG
jgi:hypothetical protein